MARKHIMIGIKDIWAQNALRFAQVGHKHTIAYVAYCGIVERICGTVELIRKTEHGTLIMIKPDRDTIHHRWATMPLWVSECGQSGILDPTKADQDLEYAMRDVAVIQLRQQTEALLGAGI